MANSGSGPGDIFEVRKIRRLVELMNNHDLNEIDLRQADQRIRIRRGNEPVVTAPLAVPAAPAPAAAAAPAAADASASATPAEDPPNIVSILSPMVGTFYRAANPESPAYANVGDAIGPESTVCIVEAMKVFNEIPAECSGKIVAVLVENGDPVEHNQPLFKVDTAS